MPYCIDMLLGMLSACGHATVDAFEGGPVAFHAEFLTKSGSRSALFVCTWLSMSSAHGLVILHAWCVFLQVTLRSCTEVWCPGPCDSQCLSHHIVCVCRAL